MPPARGVPSVRGAQGMKGDSGTVADGELVELQEILSKVHVVSFLLATACSIANAVMVGDLVSWVAVAIMLGTTLVRVYLAVKSDNHESLRWFGHLWSGAMLCIPALRLLWLLLCWFTGDLYDLLDKTGFDVVNRHNYVRLVGYLLIGFIHGTTLFEARQQREAIHRYLMALYVVTCVTAHLITGWMEPITTTMPHIIVPLLVGYYGARMVITQLLGPMCQHIHEQQLHIGRLESARKEELRRRFTRGSMSRSPSRH
jgi:hypothetical protein